MFQRRVKAVCLLALAIFSAAYLCAQPVRRMLSTGDVNVPYQFYNGTDFGSYPVWSRGSLIVFEGNDSSGPMIHAFEKDGHEIPVVFSVSGASKVHISHAALGVDASLAVAGYASDRDGHISGFISWITPDRQSSTTVRLSGYYHPQFVALAPDGTMWVEGWESSEPTGAQLLMTAPIMRHYDQSGKMIGSALPQKNLLSKMPRFILTGGEGYMVTSSNTIGWIAGDSAYYELSYSGDNVTEYPPVPLNKHGVSALDGFAMTDDGRVFAQLSVYLSTHPAHGMHLYQLDRSAKQWVEVAEAPVGRMVPGASGNSLLFWDGQSKVHHLFAVE